MFSTLSPQSLALSTVWEEGSGPYSLWQNTKDPGTAQVPLTCNPFFFLLSWGKVSLEVIAILSLSLQSAGIIVMDHQLYPLVVLTSSCNELCVWSAAQWPRTELESEQNTFVLDSPRSTYTWTDGADAADPPGLTRFPRTSLSHYCCQGVSPSL